MFPYVVDWWKGCYHVMTVICHCVGHGTAFYVVFRNVGGNIRDGITGLSGYVLCVVHCLWSVCLHIDGLLVTFEFIFFFSGPLCRNQENLHILLRTNLEVPTTSIL